MSPRRIKGCVWLSMLLAMFLGFMADLAGATIGAKNQPLPVKNDLLQFRAGSHIMGFKPEKVYLVNTAGFLSVEFLGAHTVTPQTAAVDAGQPRDDVTLPQRRGNTLANLQRVEYPSLWDGITLHYEAVVEGIAESTYFIQPGADVAQIRLRYNCDTELQQDGSLKIQLPARQGYLTESRPVAWQIIAGQTKPVQVAYKIQDGAIGFQVGDYNKDHELIIDPTYQWHTFYGATGSDRGSGIAVDGGGNVYVTGRSEASWNSSALNGVLPKHAHSGGSDIVILKLNSSGQYQWHTFYGSAGSDLGDSIAVDGSGNAYVTGYSDATWVSSAPLGVAPKHAHSGGSDIVILKLNNSGAYQWHTFYGSASSDRGYGIAVDGSGNAYVTGYSDATWNSSAPIGVLPKHEFSGGYDIVILKLNSSGSYQWHTFYGSAGSEQGYGIAVDGSENVYVSGNSNNGDWGSPPPVNGYSDGTDIVVIKLNSPGTLDGYTFYGSTSDDYAGKITVDQSGDIYITGDSDATWGNPVHAHSGKNDIVVIKMASSGILVWNTFHGSPEYDYGIGIAVDGSGHISVTGNSDSTWGNPTHHFTGSSGSDDIVVVKLDGSGGLVWNTFYGSPDWDYGNDVAVDRSGATYVTGASFATWGSPLNGLNSADDIVILKLAGFPWPMFLPGIIKGGQ